MAINYRLAYHFAWLFISMLLARLSLPAQEYLKSPVVLIQSTGMDGFKEQAAGLLVGTARNNSASPAALPSVLCSTSRLNCKPFPSTCPAK